MSIYRVFGKIFLMLDRWGDIGLISMVIDGIGLSRLTTRYSEVSGSWYCGVAFKIWESIWIPIVSTEISVFLQGIQDRHASRSQGMCDGCKCEAVGSSNSRLKVLATAFSIQWFPAQDEIDSRQGHLWWGKWFLSDVENPVNNRE